MPTSSLQPQTATKQEEEDAHDDSFRQKTARFKNNVIKKPRRTAYRVAEIYDLVRIGTIDLDPPYQRDPVWIEAKQTALIDSIFHGYYVPPLVFNVTEGSKKVKSCIDGKQRLTSIIKFMDGQISCKDPETGSNCWFNDSSGRKNVLRQELQEFFENCELDCYEYQGLKQKDELEIFRRVQCGQPLSTGEKEKAISSPRALLVSRIDSKYFAPGHALSSCMNAQRGKGFIVISLALCTIHGWDIEKKNKIVTSTPQADKWLKSTQGNNEKQDDSFVDVDAGFEEKLIQTFDVAKKLASTDKWKRPFTPNTISKKIAPVEMVAIAVLIHAFYVKSSITGPMDDEATLQRLSDCIFVMRDIITEAYRGEMKLNDKVGRELSEMIQEILDDSNAFLAKHSSRLRTGQKRKFADVGADSDDDSDDEPASTVDKRRKQVQSSPPPAVTSPSAISHPTPPPTLFSPSPMVIHELERNQVTTSGQPAVTSRSPMQNTPGSSATAQATFSYPSPITTSNPSSPSCTQAQLESVSMASPHPPTSTLSAPLSNSSVLASSSSALPLSRTPLMTNSNPPSSGTQVQSWMPPSAVSKPSSPLPSSPSLTNPHSASSSYRTRLGAEQPITSNSVRPSSSRNSPVGITRPNSSLQFHEAIDVDAVPDVPLSQSRSIDTTPPSHTGHQQPIPPSHNMPPSYSLPPTNRTHSSSSQHTHSSQVVHFSPPAVANQQPQRHAISLAQIMPTAYTQQHHLPQPPSNPNHLPYYTHHQYPYLPTTHFNSIHQSSAMAQQEVRGQSSAPSTSSNVSYRTRVTPSMGIHATMDASSHQRALPPPQTVQATQRNAPEMQVQPYLQQQQQGQTSNQELYELREQMKMFEAHMKQVDETHKKQREEILSFMKFVVGSRP